MEGAGGLKVGILVRVIRDEQPRHLDLSALHGAEEAEGIAVVDYRNFSVTDNQEVGRIPSERLMSALDDLRTDGADAVVLSACVQMPSIAALDMARARLGMPVTSTAECTSRVMLRSLGLEVHPMTSLEAAE